MIPIFARAQESCVAPQQTESQFVHRQVILAMKHIVEGLWHPFDRCKQPLDLGNGRIYRCLVVRINALYDCVDLVRQQVKLAIPTTD